jgi:hypothetical protein
MMNPIITKDTIIIDEAYQKIIAACKRNVPHLEALKEAVAEITGLLIEHVDYGAMYHWLRETFRALGKVNLLITLLDNTFSPSGMYSILYKDLNFDERFLSMMCSELCNLQINDHNENGELIALIDMSKAS